MLVFARPSFYREIFLVDSQAMAKATVGLLPRVVSPTLASAPKPRTHDLVRLAPSQCRHLHRAPPRQEEKLSFRGQLYESTAQRLARERAEEARFAATRSAQGNSTLRLFATTFCMRDPQLLPEFDEEGREPLTVAPLIYSHPRRLRRQLLLRHACAQRTPHNLHYIARCSSATAARYAGLGDASCLGRLGADCRQRECVYE